MAAPWVLDRCAGVRYLSIQDYKGHTMMGYQLPGRYNSRKWYATEKEEANSMRSFRPLSTSLSKDQALDPILSQATARGETHAVGAARKPRTPGGHRMH